MTGNNGPPRAQSSQNFTLSPTLQVVVTIMVTHDNFGQLGEPKAKTSILPNT